MLQEVDDWYASPLQSELHSLNYEFSYCQKAFGSKEGNAICFRKDKFKCLGKSIYLEGFLGTYVKSIQ